MYNSDIVTPQFLCNRTILRHSVIKFNLTIDIYGET
nr:MAG TPA: hypothetical protein [Caudoviricetes sp.]